MEKRHIDRRLAQMEAEGTEFRAERRGRSQRRHRRPAARRYDAVVLGGGATAWRDLPVPGRELRGIHQAMEYLPRSEPRAAGRHRGPPITAEGKHVVIIGGGDTGADCLGTAHRQGAALGDPARDPAPPARRARRRQPVAAVEPRLPRHVRPRGGRRARVQREHRALRRRRRRQRAGAAASTRSSWATAGSRRSTAPTASCPPTSCSWRSASSDRSEGAWLDQLGVEFDERGNVARDDAVHVERAGRVRRRRHGPRPEPDRVGDRRGTGLRGGRRPLVDGRDLAAVADPADGTAVWPDGR